MPQARKPDLQKILKRQKLMGQEILMYQNVMEGMRRGLKFEHLLKLIIRSVCDGMGFRRAGIFLVEPDGEAVRLALGLDKNGNFEKNKELIPLYPQRGATYFSDVINGYKKFFYSNNIPKRLPKKAQFRVPVFNNALVPFQLGKGRAIGALAVDNLDQNRTITLSDVASLMNYATQVGLAIESFRIHEKVLNLSVTDPMTSLFNRRYFDRALAQELSRSQRYARSFSLLMIDLDHFKRVNDTYGHDAGDQVIQQVSTLLRKSLRGLDILARVGGEEFAVLLPETPPQNVAIVANRILREVANAVPPVRQMEQKGERVTVSIGLATYRGGDVSPLSIYKMADNSLYRAKRAGRNRCGPLNDIYRIDRKALKIKGKAPVRSTPSPTRTRVV